MWQLMENFHTLWKSWYIQLNVSKKSARVERSNGWQIILPFYRVLHQKKKSLQVMYLYLSKERQWIGFYSNPCSRHLCHYKTFHFLMEFFLLFFISTWVKQLFTVHHLFTWHFFSLLTCLLKLWREKGRKDKAQQPVTIFFHSQVTSISLSLSLRFITCPSPLILAVHWKRGREREEWTGKKRWRIFVLSQSCLWFPFIHFLPELSLFLTWDFFFVIKFE